MKNKMHEPVYCAHYLSKYLPVTHNWVYKVITNHKKFTPLLLSRKQENLSLFPFSALYSLDRLGKLRQVCETVYQTFFGYFLFFKNICNRFSVEILHVHFGHHGIKMLALKKRLNIPMVCSFYGDDVFLNVHNHRYEQLFKHVDMVLVLGAYMKRTIVEMGCPEEKVVIHHLGVDVSSIRFIKRKAASSHMVRFLLASSFVEKKGIDIAIQALADFIDRDFSLDIVGGGPLQKEVIQWVEASGYQERITLHGYQPYDYFINLAYECDVFIQASRTTSRNNKEGTPMAIVDALSTGITVISTKHSDIPEIIQDGVNGYLAEENDLISLKACIQKTFDNKDKFETFSVQGRQWVEQEFDSIKQVDKLEALYVSILKR